MSLKNKTALTAFRHYHFAIALIIMSALLTVEGWFLYRYFYQSLLATKSLIESREQGGLENIDRVSYEKVKDFYEKRKSIPAINAKTLRDPFNVTATAPALPPR